MIEEIIELGPKLQFCALTPARGGKIEILNERQILKVSSRPSKNISPQTPLEGTVDRDLAAERSGSFYTTAVRASHCVERKNQESIGSASVRQEVAASKRPGKRTGNSGPCVISQVAIGDPAVSQIEWLARLKRNDAGDFPTGKQLPPG